ncbi:MAG TPA: PP2C family protein-serine/threonine phosphatase [Acidimicrobiia bacterium]|nr:PP2C family protein-serine/threonine phosphatase [Acidimicrobiia bacterium]
MAEKEPTAEMSRAPRARLLHPAALVVLLIGLGITGVLAAGAHQVHESNEDRLLHQRLQEVGTLLSSSVPNVQTPLSSAATLAQETHGDSATFRRVVDPLLAPGRPFVSVSLWPPDGSQPVVLAGAPSTAPSDRLRALFARARAHPKTLAVEDLLDTPSRGIGYAYSDGPDKDYVVYAEAQLPQNRRSNLQSNSAFADLGYALYLGDKARSDHLIASSADDKLPLSGRHDSVTVPFGDSSLHIVMKPHKDLGGTLLQRLWWILALGGLVLTLITTALVEVLSRRREQAEVLAEQLEHIAAENARLYADQRSVAQTLQHSLLPEVLPTIPNLDLGVRYVAGVEGVDIGGDWYDVIQTNDGRLLFVVGDVSGRGLRAATIMASLRYAIRAYATQGDAPAVILEKVAALLSVGRDNHYATVLCGSIDVDGHEMIIANAGHPEPLVITEDGAQYLELPVGVPIGVAAGSHYTSVSVSLPERATLLAFTDGLVERRGESLDDGLNRLRLATLDTAAQPLEQMLTRVVREVTPDGSDDDSAVLGLRWLN